jgi:hypothetical protein
MEEYIVSFQKPYNISAGINSYLFLMLRLIRGRSPTPSITPLTVSNSLQLRCKESERAINSFDINIEAFVYNFKKKDEFNN